MFSVIFTEWTILWHFFCISYMSVSSSLPRLTISVLLQPLIVWMWCVAAWNSFVIFIQISFWPVAEYWNAKSMQFCLSAWTGIYLTCVCLGGLRSEPHAVFISRRRNRVGFWWWRLWEAGTRQQFSQVRPNQSRAPQGFPHKKGCLRNSVLSSTDLRWTGLHLGSRLASYHHSYCNVICVCVRMQFINK